MTLCGTSSTSRTARSRSSCVSRTTTETFCRNEYNLTGLCRKASCPLANSAYATVREKKGRLLLCIKTAERGFTPSLMWEEVPLDENYARALEQIDQNLQFWNKFIVHKCKQRLTKLREMVRRTRRQRIRGVHEVTALHRGTEQRDNVRMEKAERRLAIDTEIEKELVDRLKLGTYGELYDDLFNLHPQAFKKHVNENELSADEESVEAEGSVSLQEIDSDNDLEYVFDKPLEAERVGKRVKPIAGKKKLQLELEKS